MVYQYFAIISDPILSAWNEQNITPSPGWSDLLISFSPIILLGLFGLRSAWSNQKTRIILIWCAVSLLLIVFPWNLQRRFLTGLYLPLAGLGIIGLKAIAEKIGIKRRALFTILMILVLPTNLIVIVSGISASAIQDPAIYLSTDEVKMLSWIDKRAGPDDLIAADEQMGLYIPSQTGRRVIYGHPFETINAEEAQIFLDEFFNQEHAPSYFNDQVSKMRIDYIDLRKAPSESMQIWLDVDQIHEVYRIGDQALYMIGQ